MAPFATIAPMVVAQMQAHVKSAARVLDILEALARHPDGCSFTQLQQSLQFPKSSLHELISVLMGRGYIDFDATRRVYLLGIRVWENGQAYNQHHQLLREARIVMDAIVAAMNETVQLAVLDGLENVYLAKVDCSHPIRLQSDVGKRLYAHATGVGKALLSQLSDAELARRFADHPLQRFTPHTITEHRALFQELSRSRQRGYAIDNQEYTPGLQCVAVPIFDYAGQAVAAISVSIPMTRGGLPELATALQLLAASSIEVSRRLGRLEADARLRQLMQQPVAPADLGFGAVAAMIEHSPIREEEQP